MSERFLARMTLTLNNTLLDRFHRHPHGPHEVHRGADLVLLPRQQHCHDPDLVLDARLPNVERDFRELPAHLPENRLFHLAARGEREPAALGVRRGRIRRGLAGRHGGTHLPPAIAGTMLISSPSFTGVSRFFRKRMSSSLT